MGGILGGLLVSRIVISNSIHVPEASSWESVEFDEPAHPSQPTKQSELKEPETFVIPKLGIEAQVEVVGLDEKGNMDVPKEDMNVAWYKYGPKPGEIGSSVIAGHLDSPTGPAIFYNLPSLVIGDILEVIDEEGEKQEFIVTDIKFYEDKAFPIGDVFTKNDKARLNLITCAGTFDRNLKLYSHRLVVYSELVDQTLN